MNARRYQRERLTQEAGFTLLEMLAVLVMLGILCVVGLVRYQSLMDASRQRAAAGLLSSAQSQLSLEFSRRIINDLALNVASQAVCDNVAIGSAGETTSLSCTGDLSGNVFISATVEDQTVNASWTNPAGQ